MSRNFKMLYKGEEGKVEPDSEEVQKRQAIFNVTAPVIPMLVNELQFVDPDIVGGFLMLIRSNGDQVAVTGNITPSLLIPQLKKVLAEMEGEKGQFVETAFVQSNQKGN